MTQKQKVLNYLTNGAKLTPTQALNRGINNVYEVVRQLREEGHAIYLNKRAGGRTFYRLGTPTKRMVAAAFAAEGASAFN